MNLYDKASLIITPNAYKAGKIYADKPTSGAADLTFTRAGAGSRRNEIGVFDALANNVPSLHYPLDGGCPGWAAQPQRTNLFLNPNAAATQNITVVIGQVYTITTWGTVTATCSGAGVGVASNNGSFTFTATTNTLTVTISGLSGQAYVNCGLGADIWITPIIVSPTSTTRPGGLISLTGASAMIGQTEGTLFAEINLTHTNNVIRWILALTNGSNNNTIALLVNNPSGTSNRLSCFVNSGGATQALIDAPALPTIGRHKLVMAYSSNNIRLWVDGVLIGTDLSATIPATSVIDLGHRNTADSFNSLIGTCAIFSNRLTDAECLALSTL